MTASAEVTRAQRRRQVLTLALPATATLIADPLLGLVDTAIAGRVSTEALAALGLSIAVLASFSWAFNFLVYGTTPVVAKALGAGDPESAGRRVAHAAVVAAVLGLIGMLVLLFAAPALVRVLGSDASFGDEAVTYLRVRAFGLPALLLGYVATGAFRGAADTRTPLYVAIAANVLNGTLDVVLVYGFEAGLAGIAAATVAAEWASVLLLVPLLLRKTPMPLRGHGLPDRAALRHILSVSRDLFMRTGALLLGILAVTSAGARMGTATAAAHQVMFEVWLAVSLLLDGLAIAAQTMIGTALGRGDPDEVRALTRQLIRMGLGLGTVMAVVLLALSSVAPNVLTSDVAVLAIVGNAWWIMAIGQPVGAVVFVLDGVLMGAEDFAFLRTVTVIAALAAAGVAWTGLSMGGGIVWLWAAVSALLVFRAAPAVRRAYGDAWITTSR